MADISRRAALKIGVLGGVALATAGHARGGSNLRLGLLIAALRTTGRPVCLAQADAFETSQVHDRDYDLHLRQAGLDARQAQAIAGAIRTEWSQYGSALRSLSMSYNPGLGDAGARSLALALPPTVTEFGLVGCAVGDEGGEALLNWAKQARELRLICVEDNHLSRRLRDRFSAIGQLNSKLVVVV